MKPSELQPFELMQLVVSFLEQQEIAYRVVGSLASMVYGEPRFTNDVDLLVDLPMTKVRELGAAFPAPDFYLSESAAREAIANRRQFHILHIPSGFKVDVIIPSGSEYSRTEMNRGKKLASEGEFSAWFCSPEDVILNKLIYFQQGGSDKHFRDIASMFKLQGGKIDKTYLANWALKLGILETWQLFLLRLEGAPE